MSLCFITGATGFLGSHLVEALLDRGHEIRALVRHIGNKNHARSSYLERLCARGAVLVDGDLAAPAGLTTTLQSALPGVDTVFHCAAAVSDWGRADWFRALNVDAVRTLCEASKNAGVRHLLHISTTDVYGHRDRRVDETAEFVYRNWPYGYSKIDGEKIVWEYHRNGLPATVVRPANVYGPRSISLVGDIVDLIESQSMLHVGTGEKDAGLAYVGNVVDLILRASESQTAIGQAYNACDDEGVTWKQYVDRLAQSIGAPLPKRRVPYKAAFLIGALSEVLHGLLRIQKRPLITRMAATVFGTHQSFSIEKAKNDLGFTPRVRFDEGIDRTVEWLTHRNRE